MPKVGSKHFAYTPAGQKAAKQEAARTGQKVERPQPKGGKKK